MNRATLLKRTNTRAFSESRDGKIYQKYSFSDDKQQDPLNKRMRGGDQTAATKATMAEAKVAD